MSNKNNNQNIKMNESKKRRAEKMKQTEWDAVHSMHSFKLNLIKKKQNDERKDLYIRNYH